MQENLLRKTLEYQNLHCKQFRENLKLPHKMPVNQI